MKRLDEWGLLLHKISGRNGYALSMPDKLDEWLIFLLSSCGFVPALIALRSGRMKLSCQNGPMNPYIFNGFGVYFVGVLVEHCKISMLADFNAT